MRSTSYCTTPVCAPPSGTPSCLSVATIRERCSARTPLSRGRTAGPLRDRQPVVRSGDTRGSERGPRPPARARHKPWRATAGPGQNQGLPAALSGAIGRLPHSRRHGWRPAPPRGTTNGGPGGGAEADRLLDMSKRFMGETCVDLGAAERACASAKLGFMASTYSMAAIAPSRSPFDCSSQPRA